MVREIENEGYVFVGWDVDTKDWNNDISSTTIVTTVINHATPNDILIFHDGHENGTNYPRENTIAALPAIIDELKKQGYTFVTIDKIIDMDAYVSK
jgi:peptidoglycan/xylan/chitin deacetylase (PgdA/CDA1 family)